MKVSFMSEKSRHKIYKSFENLDVYSICRSRGIEIDWILEAGCHDGTDTKSLAEFFLPNKYYAFEPDEVARLKAQSVIKDMNSLDIKLSHKGLSDTNSSKFLRYAAEGKGSGSTSLEDSGDDVVEVCRFDDEYEVILNNGLLWLDVEGHAIPALEGMELTLNRFVLARIEVQLHTRGEGFTQDYKQVAKLMKRAKLVPVFGPVYPGFFGDIIFIKSNLLTMHDKFRALTLKILMSSLHGYLYPALGKPQKYL
jgi:FkbM family methyltransferase